MRSMEPTARSRSLFEALNASMNTDELKRLAGITGVGKLPARKAELAQVIVGHLEGDGLRRVWEGLDRLQQAAVSEVVHSPRDGYDGLRFLAKYGDTPVWGTARADTRFGPRDPTPSALCLFFDGHRVMPTDLKRRLAEFVPPPAATVVKTVDHLPSTFDLVEQTWDEGVGRTAAGVVDSLDIEVRETERVAQRELLTALRLVDVGKLGVSDKTHRPTGAAVKALEAALDAPDFCAPDPDDDPGDAAGPIRPYAWPMLLQAGGLVRLSGKRLELTKAGRAALSVPPHETIAALWQKWVKTSLCDELTRIDCIKGQTGKGKRGLTPVLSRRLAVEKVLVDCPPQRWIHIDDFLRFMRATENALELTRDPWTLYMSDQQYGSLGYGGSIGLAGDRYVFCLLLEYAATLGLIDVATVPPAGARDDFRDLWGVDDLPYLSRYDGLLYIRMTRMGARCLDVPVDDPLPSAAPEAKPVLRVLATCDIAAVGADVGNDDRLALDAFATRTSDVVWRLTIDSLLEAVERGRPMAELREFLKSRSAAPLPNPVVHLIAEVEERVTRLRNGGPALLVECADAVLAAQIARDSKTRAHCMIAGERHLAVPMPSEAAFRRGLRRAGFVLRP